jgi:Zn-dependent protease
MPGGAITLFHLRGIRVSVDYSWFVVLFLIILWLSGFYGEVTGDTGGVGAYALAVASALLFFGSILLHELGHAIVAIRRGIGISGITLWMFGGVAQLERDSDSPGTEFKIAIAGPVVTLLIAAATGAAAILVSNPSDYLDAAFTNRVVTSESVALLGWLSGINVLLLLFNLIPAFPLDGGRIARAIAWRRSGDRNKATRFAATLGQGFGMFLILVGIGYFMVYLGAVISGLWLAVIGFILRGSARSAIVQSELTSRIEGISVGDVMDREPVAIPESMPIERALDEYFLRYGYPWFPVVDGGQRFVGLIDQGAAELVSTVERPVMTVGDVLARDSGTASVDEDSPLEALLSNQALRRLGALVAVDSEGRLRGVITLDAVGRALRP